MKYFKLNQTVYHHVYGEGVVISTSDDKQYPIKVRFKNHESDFTEDGRRILDNAIVLSQTKIGEIMNIPIEDTYVPFTIDNDLLGQTVISKDKSCKGIITYQDKYKIVIGNYHETYEVLLKDYTFMFEKPCGKLG